MRHKLIWTFASPAVVAQTAQSAVSPTAQSAGLILAGWICIVIRASVRQRTARRLGSLRYSRRGRLRYDREIANPGVMRIGLPRAS